MVSELDSKKVRSSRTVGVESPPNSIIDSRVVAHSSASLGL